MKKYCMLLPIELVATIIKDKTCRRLNTSLRDYWMTNANYYIKNPDHIDWLWKWRNLRMIISGEPYMSVLDEMTRLHIVELNCWYRLDTYQQCMVSMMTNLTRLKLHHVFVPSPIFLSTLINLKCLFLWGIYTDLSPLSGLTRLKKLSIGCGATDTSPLTHLNLQVLDINLFSSYPPVYDISRIPVSGMIISSMSNLIMSDGQKKIFLHYDEIPKDIYNELFSLVFE